MEYIFRRLVDQWAQGLQGLLRAALAATHAAGPATVATISAHGAAKPALASTAFANAAVTAFASQPAAAAAARVHHGQLRDQPRGGLRLLAQLQRGAVRPRHRHAQRRLPS